MITRYMIGIIAAIFLFSTINFQVKAEVLEFTISGVDNATFILGNGSTPSGFWNGSIDPIFEFLPGTYNGLPTRFDHVVFFSSDDLGGLDIGTNIPEDQIGGLLVSVYGPQVYSGLDKSPIFSPGTFSLEQYYGGPSVDTLNIAVVPVPGTLPLYSAALSTIICFHFQRHPRRRSGKLTS